MQALSEEPDEEELMDGAPSETARTALANAQVSINHAAERGPRPGMGDGLTLKQHLFCKEYPKDLNGTQAAIRAGYVAASAGVQANKLLKQEKIQAGIARVREALSEATDMDAQWVLERLRDNYNYAISGKRRDLSAANKSLELIGKHLGMFKDRLEVTTPFIERLLLMSDEQLAALEAEERAKLTIEGECEMH